MTTIYISYDNVSRYRKGPFPDVTGIEWDAGTRLEGYFLRRFPNLEMLSCRGCGLLSLRAIKGLTKLKVLDCSNNKLVSLEAIRGLNLRILRCSNNGITRLDGIQSCTDLEVLDCSSNRLHSLVEESGCQRLRELLCSSNRLRSIQGIKYFPNLVKVDCGSNPLQSIAAPQVSPSVTELHCSSSGLLSLEGIGDYVGLEVLRCRDNRLTSLAGIEACTRLRDLNCAQNALTAIDSIITLSNLRSFACEFNQIASLDPIVYLKRLNYFQYSNNPLEIQSVRCQRYIARYQTAQYPGRYGGVYAHHSESTVYDNGQNVHDVHIQQSVCRSLSSLLTDPNPTFTSAYLQTMIMRTNMSDQVKQLLTRYCADKSMHSVHMINYEELLGYVWNRITGSEHSTELFKILSQLILDSDGKCFTGRFNRTLSVLVGFYPDIKIEIADTSRISAIIITIQKRIDPYDPTIHAEVATIELQEAGYSLDEIKPWLDAIHETIND